jgi:single-strand DNA-binding protein
VVIFNENIARVAEQYLKKGSKVYVEGQLQTRKYQDQSGVEKYSTEIVIQRFRGDLTLLDGRGGGQAAATMAATTSRARSAGAAISAARPPWSDARRLQGPAGAGAGSATTSTTTSRFSSIAAAGPGRG